jgi:prolyl oligopeptidase
MNRVIRSFSVVVVVVALTFGENVTLRAGAQSSALAAQTTVAKAPPVTAGGADPFLWLEDKDGARSMAWVKTENAKTLPVLQSDPHYVSLYADALKIAQAKGRIPVPSILHGAIYNFWQDDQHVRGIFRRTTATSYASATPHWTTVLDLDALATSEKANWVWEGVDCYWPAEQRCLLALSDGGEDARTIREFDLATDRSCPADSRFRAASSKPRGRMRIRCWFRASGIRAS